MGAYCPACGWTSVRHTQGSPSNQPFHTRLMAMQVQVTLARKAIAALTGVDGTSADVYLESLEAGLAALDRDLCGTADELKAHLESLQGIPAWAVRARIVGVPGMHFQTPERLTNDSTPDQVYAYLVGQGIDRRTAEAARAGRQRSFLEREDRLRG